MNSSTAASPIVTCNMKQTLIILVCLIFFSCKKEVEVVNNPPYFTFDKAAREWFSDLKVHDTLKFLSNSGNVRIYEVNAIDTSKVVISGDCGTIIGACMSILMMVTPSYR